MAGLPRFKALAEKFIRSLELSGATVLVESSDLTQRPAKLSVLIEDSRYRLHVYLWNITPGGKGRNRPNERRIQRTSMDSDRFVLRAGVRTIMGGWHEETGTFAFWDVRRHLQAASSPSSQIPLETLEHAQIHGMATVTRRLKGATEVAIAVQPDFLVWYVQEYERIYDAGGEVSDAADLIGSSLEEERNFIDEGDEPRAISRRHTLIEVVRNFRDHRFRPEVLRAYGFRCCLTGVALRLVDAAHIVPHSDPSSTDEARNGLALNPLLHRAYDSGLLGILPNGGTALNGRLIATLNTQNLGDGLDLVRSLVPAQITAPTSPEFAPPPEYLRRGLLARGWSSEEIAEASA